MWNSHLLADTMPLKSGTRITHERWQCDIHCDMHSNMHFAQLRFELFPICFSQELGFAGRLSKGARCDILSKGCGFCSMDRPILKSARKAIQGEKEREARGEVKGVEGETKRKTIVQKPNPE